MLFAALRFLGLLSSPAEADQSPRPAPKSEAHKLEQNILRWRAQAQEKERMGFDMRQEWESIRAHEQELKRLRGIPLI